MRAAANNPNYTFVLRNDNNGRYLQDVTISLPSTSTVVKRTLAAPQLVGWAYRTTRDIISGTAAVLLDDPNVSNMDFYEMLTDADQLEEYLKDNKLRPDDQRDERASEGTREHKTLEAIAAASVAQQDGEVDLVQKLLQSDNGYERAIAGWWAEVIPVVVESETILPCPQHGYCGSVDLIWYDGETKIVTDLKTRRAGLGAYDSDMFQVEGYMTAYDLMHPEAPSDRGSVLIAREDGTWEEVEMDLPRGSFLDLKKIHDTIRRGK